MGMVNLDPDHWYADDIESEGIFGLKPGSWSIHSKLDHRWDRNGTGMVGMFSKPEGVKKAEQELRELYGEPPIDLEWSYMKD